MSVPQQIGFPPPLLSDRPLRLKVVWDHPLGFALEKPPGVLVLGDNWYPRTPVLVEALNYQAAQGKGELQRLGLGPEGARAIIQSEPGLAGLTLFSKDPETGAFWANAYGSELFELRIRLLAARAPAEDELECDLPIARHAQKTEMLVSHRTGKKARTVFKRIENLGRYSLWEATTRFCRMHQIQLHAFELGIHLVGDGIYSAEEELYLSQLKRNFTLKGDHEDPLYPGVAMYLAGLTFPLPEGETVRVDLDPPKRFNALTRSIERYGR